MKKNIVPLASTRNAGSMLEEKQAAAAQRRLTSQQSMLEAQGEHDKFSSTHEDSYDSDDEEKEISVRM
jgi:hypothetical protein